MRTNRLHRSVAPAWHAADPVAAAVGGDDAAWRDLVVRYDGLLRGVARGFALTPEERDDAVQRTWLRAVEHLADIRDPRCLPGWLATAARHECIAVCRQRRRVVPLEDVHDRPADAALDVVDVIVSVEDAAALRHAVARLSTREAALITYLLDHPSASYVEVGDRLGMPLGSIGPVRGRALRKLRAMLAPSIAADAA